MLSAIKGKFSSSSAVLQLVLNTEENRTFSPLSYMYAHMVECFRAITIDAKHFTVHVGVSNTVLHVFFREINRFLETLSSFCIFEKALFLDPRDSRLDPRSFRASRLEDRVSRFEFRVSTYF